LRRLTLPTETIRVLTFADENELTKCSGSALSVSDVKCFDVSVAVELTLKFLTLSRIYYAAGIQSVLFVI